MKQTLIIKQLPTLLNRLYIPTIKNGKPTIIKNKEAKEFTKFIQYECIRSKIKPLEGTISFKCDILIKTRKNFDIDSIFKLLLDSLNKYAYNDDKQIIELIIRKHLNAEYDGLHICIENIE